MGLRELGLTSWPLVSYQRRKGQEVRCLFYPKSKETSLGLEECQLEETLAARKARPDDRETHLEMY